MASSTSLCFCPLERLAAPSPTCVSRPSGAFTQSSPGVHFCLVSELFGSSANACGHSFGRLRRPRDFLRFIRLQCRGFKPGRSWTLSNISCKATPRGRVGTVGSHDKQGNVSLASFGLKPRRLSGSNNGDFAKALSALLPYVVVATAVAALVQPSTFTWVSKEYYAPALGGIMLSIGVQLSIKDFEIVLKRPKPVLVGYIAQYAFKPLLGVLVAKLFNMPAAFYSGFILMACVAGAQLSSYASYLSDGDVALSIILTSLSTITSAIVTPLLTWLLIGSVVPVDGIAMAKSILQIVLCPVMLGLGLNTYAKPAVDVIRPVMPVMAMVCTSMCIGSPLALNKAHVVSLEGLRLLAPVVVFHIAAFTFGYWMARLPALRLDDKSSKTLSLCTGMQSSTLAGLLATQFLGGTQAVPPACSVVVMAVLGLSLASFWGNGNSLSVLWGRSDDRNLLANLQTQRGACLEPCVP
ncbi:hypothetical protein GOP47_0029142 [Adiantum capillus-veneris]|nr:hypothetical protein GOP47_0029142 [Adiantum capillus-veneris]